MYKRFISVVLSTAMLCSMGVILTQEYHVFAEGQKTYYEMDYEVLNADNDSVSVANDYFEKPAVLIEVDGEKYVQFSINYSKWVVGLQAPQGEDFVDVDNLKEDEEADTRVVQFAVAEEEGFSEPIEMKMHIVVDTLDEPYDHHYTARFAFDAESMEEVDAPLEESEEEEAEEEVEETAASDKEATSASTDESVSEENSAGTLIVIILLASITGILLYSFVFKKKK